MKKIEKIDSIVMVYNSKYESVNRPFLDLLDCKSNSKDIEIIKKFWFKYWYCYFFF